jgi:hypothetical protein
MFNRKPTDNKHTLAQKHESVLWVVAGGLFMLPSIFNEPNGAFIGIGIMFIVFGLVAKKKDSTSIDDK